jgi:multiple sugar transport system substrate-binding protein
MPGGFALGHASGDANSWVHWCLWAHGGNLVDRNDKIIITSPETEAALNYAKQLYLSMVPGVASWDDASNNQAFLKGAIHWTNNSPSIYMKALQDPGLHALADDMNLASWPIGPVGRPTELHQLSSLFAMAYTPFPQACKALLAYLMEADQYTPWLGATDGYFSHTLAAYNEAPSRLADPKLAVFREAANRSLTEAGLGPLGEQSATALSEFVLVDMISSFCTGREDARNAMRIADRRLHRIYR